MCDFSVLVEGTQRDITGIFCGDLLSWVMGRAKQGDAWFTVMGNINSIAVASLTDCACIVLCQDAVLDENAKMRAQQENISVFATHLPVFEASMALAQKLQMF